MLAISLARSQLEHFLERGGKLYWPGEEDSGPLSISEILSRDAC